MSPTLVFLLVAGALVVIALGFVLPTLWRPRRGQGRSRSQLNADIYHQQATEVQRDLSAGLIAADDAKRARDELLQRMLADIAPDAPQREAQGRRAALAVAIAVPMLAVLLYLVFGNPRDLDRSTGGSPTKASRDELELHVETASGRRARLGAAGARAVGAGRSRSSGRRISTCDRRITQGCARPGRVVRVRRCACNDAGWLAERKAGRTRRASAGDRCSAPGRTGDVR